MSNTPTPITDAGSLRAARKSVMPGLVEYRTTDSRIVDAVRMLDKAADEIDRLMMDNIKLREEKAELVGALEKCFYHLGDEIKRKSLNDSARDGTQALSMEVGRVLDTVLAKHTKGTTT